MNMNNLFPFPFIPKVNGSFTDLKYLKLSMIFVTIPRNLYFTKADSFYSRLIFFRINFNIYD